MSSDAIGTLYTVPEFPPGQRILAVAALAGLRLDIAQNYTHYQDNKKPEYIAKFASGKIPALEMKDGFTLFETSTIVRYIASLAPDAKLLGTNANEAILVDQWMTYVDHQLILEGVLINAFLDHYIPYNENMDTMFRTRQESAFEKVDNYLSKHKFFVGDNITVADIHITSVLIGAMKTTFDSSLRTKYPHLTRHFNMIMNEPKISAIFGEVTFIEKAKQYVPKMEKSD